MRFLLVLTSTFVALSSAKDCLSDGFNKRCLPKSEAGPFGFLYKGGDPCFKRNGKNFCLVDVGAGMLHPCTCTSECGCSGETVAPTPSCPSDKPPKAEDCSDQDKYCSLGNDNTMCKYCGIGPDCNSAVCSNELSTNEIQEILDKHNELRSLVAQGNQAGQPSATNMNKLTWDSELARNAQRWADQCPDDPPHDPNRKTLKFPMQPGQNKADSWNSVNDFDWQLSTKIQSWYDEVKDFPSDNVKAFSMKGATGVIGHYTQVVWAETKKVGCGVMYYKDSRPKSSSYPYRKTLVCNYYPPGNYLGQPVYKEGGSPGSNCTNGSENGLCL